MGVFLYVYIAGFNPVGFDRGLIFGLAEGAVFNSVFGLLWKTDISLFLYAGVIYFVKH